MIRYWFEFDITLNDWSSKQTLLRAGCGVTAHDIDDALQLIRDVVLQGGPLPPLKRVEPDIDISTLDAKHILPNIDSVLRHGVWFPNLLPEP